MWTGGAYCFLFYSFRLLLSLFTHIQFCCPFSCILAQFYSTKKFPFCWPIIWTDWIPFCQFHASCGNVSLKFLVCVYLLCLFHTLVARAVGELNLLLSGTLSLRWWGGIQWWIFEQLQTSSNVVPSPRLSSCVCWLYLSLHILQLFVWRPVVGDFFYFWYALFAAVYQTAWSVACYELVVGTNKAGNQCMLMMVIDISSPCYTDYGYLFAWHCISLTSRQAATFRSC